MLRFIEVGAGSACRQQVDVGTADPRQQTNFGGGLGEREAIAEPPPAKGESAKPTGNPQGILRICRPWPLQSMAAKVVDRMRGSKWQSALPTGSRWLRAQPGGSADR